MKVRVPGLASRVGRQYARQLACNAERPGSSSGSGATYESDSDGSPSDGSLDRRKDGDVGRKSATQVLDGDDLQWRRTRRRRLSASMSVSDGVSSSTSSTRMERGFEPSLLPQFSPLRVTKSLRASGTQ
jgi:hypothetical protein